MSKTGLPNTLCIYCKRRWLIDRTTHAIMHPNEETLYYDAKLLCQYGMGDCNWITEVSEKDYSTRNDQVNEIKMLSNQKIKLEE